MAAQGVVARLQIQTRPLKVGEGDARWYDVRGIQAVPAVRLTARGVVGLIDGHELLDVHHQDHPQSRNRQARGSTNAVSFNLTAHYDLMSRQYGPHIWPGCGGENILVQLAAPATAAALAQGLAIETRDGRVWLRGVTAAAPCLPFSRFALNKPHRPSVDLVKNALIFLGDGMRGFYAAYDGHPVEIALGDPVHLAG